MKTSTIVIGAAIVAGAAYLGYRLLSPALAKSAADERTAGWAEGASAMPPNAPIAVAPLSSQAQSDLLLFQGYTILPSPPIGTTGLLQGEASLAPPAVNVGRVA